ncbi:MAG TPA: BatA domain-containing protein [Polyangia bacterium]|nr:BatA domain-containing protein [Polyangia bacterium]
MHFLAPLFLAGLAATLVPILVHLIGRRRARTVRFSAMDFLFASQKKVATRLRLRQLLLLLARLGAIAAVPLALARPFAVGRADLPATVARAQSAVLVLDDSASMRVRMGRTPLFERAQARAREILGLLGRDSEVALVLGSEGADAPVGELTQDRARVGRVIDAQKPSLKAADLALAVRRAAQILSTAGHSERRVFVLTDGAAHAWDAAGPPPPDRSPAVVLVDVTEGALPKNHAIVGAEVGPASQLGPRGVKLTAEIANFSDVPEKDLAVTLRVGGRAVARGLADVPAHGRARKAFLHAFPEGGYYDVVLELPEDALAVDDRRFVRVEVRKQARVLLVDGDPRTIRRDDELFYLETALRPGEAAVESQLEVQSVPADGLPKKLSDYDVIFLCNAKAPPAAAVAALRAFVEAGGGLFISVGENVDPDAYQAALGDLLPQPLKGARAIAPERRTEGESGLEGEGPAERLGRIDRRHPMLTVFSEDAVLRKAPFYRLMLLAPTPDTESRRTLLRFESGAPALVEAEIGQGRVLLFTSTIDRDWTKLPINPDFTPLMQQAARYLARAPMREPEPPGVVGRPHQLPILPEVTRIEVTLPQGAHKLFDRAELSGRRELAFADTWEPGFYHVATAAADGTLEPRPALDFAVNLDAKESDFAKARVSAPAAAGAGERSAQASADAPTRRIELWHAVAAALLVFLLLEGTITRRG